jgi:hypothetical protein
MFDAILYSLRCYLLIYVAMESVKLIVKRLCAERWGIGVVRP